MGMQYFHQEPTHEHHFYILFYTLVLRTCGGSHYAGLVRWHHHHHSQNNPFWAIAFLRRFYQIASSFHFFGFRKNIFYTARSSALYPASNLDDQVSVLYNVGVPWPLLTTSVTCYATEDAGRIVNWFITIPITRNCIHSQLFLTLLHMYTAYNHLFHSYMFTQFTCTTL
jgi:hypothetical protein